MNTKYLKKSFKYGFDILSVYNMLNWMPDKMYLQLKYRIHFGKKLNLNNPVTFSEKLQWLKLYDRKDFYTTMVDKQNVKKYVAQILGEKYIIPTYGVWDTFDEIDFNCLPDSFVLKTTHDSGGIVICKNKSEFDKVNAKEKINRCLKRNYYLRNREWPYKNVPRRIIAEKYMIDESGTELKDYKIFNFNGEPKMIQLDYDRFCNHKRNLYTTEWDVIDVNFKYESDINKYSRRPNILPELLEMARLLSKDIPFVRTDFYIINNQIYFGELTFFPEGGFGNFSKEEMDKALGILIDLPS